MNSDEFLSILEESERRSPELSISMEIFLDCFGEEAGKEDSDFSISDDEFLKIVEENERYETEKFFEDYHEVEKYFEDWYNSMK